MKHNVIRLTTALVLGFGFAACSGGGGLPGQEVASSESCNGTECMDTSIHEAGNFTLGEVTTDSAEALPDMDLSSDGDTLTLSCPDDANTEGGFVSLNCNLDSYYAVYALCVRGVVNFADESDTETFYTTSCQSVDFYCDEYGFGLAESCNSSNLVQGLQADETGGVNASTNADKFLDLVELGFAE